MQRTIKFVRHIRDSKNCCRYVEVAPEGQPTVLDQLYVQKWFAQNAKELTVTIDIPTPNGAPVGNGIVATNLGLIK